jgi:hypothetical protein
MSGASVAGVVGMTGTAAAKIDKDQQDASLTIGCASSGSDDEIVYMNWRWTGGGYAEDPIDVAGISWDKRKWDLVEPNYSTSDDVKYYSRHHDGDMKGVSFEHTDTDREIDKNYWGAVKLSPTGDWTEDERNVFGSYHHTWDYVDITGIGVEAIGITVEVDRGEDKWRKGKTTDQAESTCGGGGL